MLQAIRDKVTGWIAYGIIFLISIPFALWGVNSYLGGGEAAPAAIVNGEEITARDLEQSYATYRQRLSRLFGGTIPESYGNEAMLRDQVRNQLIERFALRQYVQSQRYRIGDSELNHIIRSMDVFQQEGQFDTAIYEAQLRSQGYSPLGFEQELRIDGAMGQFETGIRATSFVLPAVRKQFSSLKNQTRKIRTIRYSATADDIKIDDSDIEQHYQLHSARYRTPEQLRIDYIEVSLDDIKQGIEVNADEVRARYEDNREAYSSPEIREASHILIKVDDDNDNEQALARINDIRNRIVNGESFADLATELSQDPGSASDGGNLGEIERGVMVQTFEAELFAMQVDQLSEPVKTGFGWHLIKLHSISGGETRSFESMRAELEDEISAELAESQIYDLVENLANLAYEQSDSLLPAAEQLGLELRTSEWFDRSSGSGIAADSQVRQQAFSPEVLQQGLNSEAIELGSERVVFLRLNELKASQQRSLEEMRETVIDELTAIRLRESNNQTGAQGLVALNGGQTLEDLAQQWSVTVNDHGFVNRQQTGVDTAISNRAFKMPKPEAGAVYDGLSLSNGDYVIVELSAVLSNDTEVDQKSLDGLTEAQMSADYLSAMKMLSGRAEVVKTPLEEL
ncbi:MAG: SurA N-terminal domain-containing protein [Gammaproteobacteria bacterium]|nr:SurA N-terminal domain-containing protein [Gammaproteobacteria bacterium]